MSLKLAPLLAFVLIATRPGDLSAAMLTIPDIPPARLTVCEALALASKQIPKDEKLRVVAIEWAQASKFRPPVSDGTQYHFIEAPEEWSWFVTFVDASPTKANNLSPVSVIRVRSNGSTEKPAWTRT